MTTTNPKLKGITLPDKPMTHCARCGTFHGTRRKGLTPVISDGQTVGWTCADCPRQGEPIRRVETGSGRARWRFTVTVTPTGSTKPVQKVGTTDTLEEAREQLATIREEMRTTGSYAKPLRLTVEELGKRWLVEKFKEVEAGNVRAGTVNGSYRSALITANVHIGHRDAASIRPADVRDLLNALKVKGGAKSKPLSRASLTKVLLAMRLIFAFALEQEWVTSNPATPVKVPKYATNEETSSRSEQQTWTPQQYRTFLAHLDTSYATGTIEASRDPWIRAGLRLTLCGLRRSEVLGVDWSSVDLAAGTVAVVASRTKVGRSNTSEINGPKTRDSRRVVQVEAIAPGTVAALRELWLSQGRPETGLVILDNLGHPVTPDAYSRRFRVACSGAGVPHLGSIHRLRHTIATVLHEAGVAPVEGASLLGHSTATHVGFYVPVSDDAGARAAARAGALLGGSATGS